MRGGVKRLNRTLLAACLPVGRLDVRRSVSRYRGLTSVVVACMILRLIMVVCPSGQRDQTVNLTAEAFAGSNPAATICPARVTGLVAPERSTDRGSPKNYRGRNSIDRVSAFQAEC